MVRGQGKRQNAQQSGGGRRGGQGSTLPEGQGQGQGRNKGRICTGTAGGGKQRGRGNSGR